MAKCYLIKPLFDNFYGVKRVESTTDTLVCFVMPREAVKEFVKHEEANKPGVYFLYNTEQNKIYIGQSGTSSKDRLDQHAKNKDWWTDAIVFTTKTNDFNSTHAKVLESRFIDRANDLEIELDNSIGSREPYSKDVLGEECRSWEHQIVEITKLLNLKLFVRKSEVNPSKESKSSKKKEAFKYPIKYKIYGKTYDWTFAFEMLTNQCERIIEIKGAEEFSEGIKKVTRRILYDKSKKSDFKYRLSDGKTTINVHGSAQEQYDRTNAVAEVFPEFKLELIYE